MNNAKKLVKNGGIGTANKTGGMGTSFVSSKNKILLMIGIAIIIILCAGVFYMRLRPRPILKVTGTDSNGSQVTNTVYIKDAVFDIYQVETQYNQYSSFYQQLYGSTYWEMEDADGEGRSGASAAKKQVMDSIKQREILCMEAEKLGYSLTDEEKKAVSENVKTSMENLTDAQKKMDGMDEDTITKNFEKNALAEKYRQVVIAECNIDTQSLEAGVSKEDYHQYTLQYYKVSNKDGSGDDAADVSAEQKETNLNNMKALQKKAKTTEDFTKLLDENDETGIQAVQTEKLIAKDMDDSTFLTKKLRKKLIKMKNGDISDVIEGEDGYYLVRMENNNDSEAYDQECESVVDEEETNQFNAKYQEFSASYTTEVQSYWKGRVKLGSYTTAE